MSETDVNNPAYVVPPGHADAPPPVPKEATPDPQTQEYLDGFAKSPDPRDPPTSELTPGELFPATTNVSGEAPATAPPVNVDVPVVTQDGAVLNCTMGNWEGTPTSYAYQWKGGGVDVGDGTAVHALTGADTGVDFSCVVTATNAAGSTVAPPSNTVTVTDPAGDAVRETSHRRGRDNHR
jgi:hypothetical protein